MDGPLHLAFGLAISTLAPGVVSAAEGEAVPKRERAISPRVAGMLAAAVQKVERESPETKPQAAPVPDAGPVGATNIVRMPSYIVRERPPPSSEEIMTKSAREKVAMQKFLGDETGLERSLNMISVAGLWEKIPVLGKVPFIVGQYDGRDAGLPVGPRTNEQRALDMYEKEKTAERWGQLSGLSPQPSAATPKECIVCRSAETTASSQRRAKICAVTSKAAAKRNVYQRPRLPGAPRTRPARGRQGEGGEFTCGP